MFMFLSFFFRGRNEIFILSIVNGDSPSDKTALSTSILLLHNKCKKFLGLIVYATYQNLISKYTGKRHGWLRPALTLTQLEH